MSDENVAADPSPAEASPERTSNRPPWRKRVLRILMLLLFFAVFIGGSAILFPVQDKVEKESSFELDIPYLALAKLLENASLGAAISRNTDSEIVTEETTKDEDNARGRLFPKILSGKRDVLRETTIRVKTKVYPGKKIIVLKTTSHFTPEQLIYTQKLAEPVTVLNNLESTFTFKPSQGVGLQGKTEVTVTYLLDVTAPGGVLYGKKELRARLDGEARNYLAAVEKSMREFIAEQVKN